MTAPFVTRKRRSRNDVTALLAQPCTCKNRVCFTQFADLEKDRNYKNDTLKATDSITYQKIKDWEIQSELSFDDFSECDSGYCGL